MHAHSRMCRRHAPVRTPCWERVLDSSGARAVFRRACGTHSGPAPVPMAQPALGSQGLGLSVPHPPRGHLDRPAPPPQPALSGPPGSSRASGSLDVIKEQAGGPAARTASAPSLGPAPLPTPSLSVSWGDNKRLPSWKVLRTWRAPRSAALRPALPERVWITAISRRGDLGCVGRTPVKQVLRAQPGRTWAVHEAGAGAAVRLGTSSAARCGPAGPGPRPR